jgi:nucleotide-binding universal stress UspA family protein
LTNLEQSGVMQNFLIPVDFSDASANALKYAFELNKHFFARLNVLHVFDVPFSASPETDTAIYEYENIRESFKERAWSFIADHKGEYHYDMEVAVTSGGHFQSVINYAQQMKSDMIILGNKGKTSLGRWFFGTVTQNLLRKAPCIAIAVPETFIWKDIKNIHVCTDFSEPLTEKQCQDLKMLAEKFSCQLNFLHVQDKVVVSLPEDNLSIHKIKQVFGKDPITVPFENSVASSLNKYISTMGGELVVTIPHHHTWLDKLFLGSETAAISEHLSVPILSLH